MFPDRKSLGAIRIGAPSVHATDSIMPPIAQRSNPVAVLRSAETIVRRTCALRIVVLALSSAHVIASVKGRREEIMSFDGKEAAEARLRDTRPLTRQDLDDLIPYLGAIGDGLTWRISADFSLQNIAAVQKFDESSSRLNSRLLGLTYWIAALTAVMTVAAALTAIPVIRPVIQSLCK
jgi:hypothetical protein